MTYKRFKATVLLGAAFVLAGCMAFRDDPYEGRLNSVTVTAVYPDGYSGFVHEGAEVQAENVQTGSLYTFLTDASGRAATRLPNGIYRFSMSDRSGSNLFNGTRDRVLVSDAPAAVELKLLRSQTGELVIKEVYSGGCSKAPLEGNYQSDKYVILHNNTGRTVFLDSLCIGTLAPYNSTASNPWPDEADRYACARIVQALLQVGGDGDDFPLASGEDAVICFNGAIDHTVQYPLSVNLNREDCFVCYNTTYFPNPLYHPAPGDKIRPDHFLNIVIKTGQANAYTLSLTSPVLVIFKAKGISIQDFVGRPEHVVQIPGSTADRVVNIPLDWIMDGVEIFDGRSGNNTKRLSPSVDAGYATLSDIYQGRTVFRKTDEAQTAKAGYEVLQDTNNSKNDFYERATQSLHD